MDNEQSTSECEDVLAGYLSKEEFCRQMKISSRTDDRWQELGLGPRRTIVGRRIFYSRETVRAWLAAKETGSAGVRKLSSRKRRANG